MAGRLDGKVAILTGSAGTLGAGTAKLLAGEGARLVLNDIAPRVHELADEIIAAGGEAVAHVGDVGKEDDVSAMVALAMDRYGRLDGLWNNAGPVSNDFVFKDSHILDMSLDYFVETFRGHVGAAFLCSKTAIPAMIRSGGGSIVNTSSSAAFAGDIVLHAYSVAKMGMITLAQSIATAYGPDNIRCNAVAPGLVPGRSSGVMAEAAIKVVQDSQMLARAGEPIDIGNAVLFMLSDESRWFTGQVMAVDGGLTGHQPTLATRRGMFGGGMQEGG